MIKCLVICLVVITFTAKQSIAQPYIDGGKTRHRFAQLNLGVDQRFFNGNNTQASFINSSENIENYNYKILMKHASLLAELTFGAIPTFLLQYLF